MRILFSSIYGPGHLNPILPYAKVLRDQGHEVRICVPQTVAGKIEKAGLVHVPVPDTSMDEIIDAFAGTQDLTEDEKDKVIIPRFFVDLLAGRALPIVREAITSWKPDLIVRESCEFAALIAAEEAQIPHVRIAVLHCLSEKKFCVLSVDANDALRGTLGMARDNGASLQAEPVFTAFPKSLGETRVAPHAPEPFRVHMPSDVLVEENNRPAWLPTTEEPLIYVTFGTQSGTTDSERAMYRTALDAVADLPVRVLLTTGPNMAEHPLGPIPSNVIVETFVPQAQVFPHARAVVTHGGSGTMLGALAAGVPLVVAPMFADQPDNARAVEATGAGVAVFGADAARLRSGIQRVLESDAILKSAKIVENEMSELPSINRAVLRMVEDATGSAVR